jgi:uncharacterized protein (DUF1800 family)
MGGATGPTAASKPWVPYVPSAKAPWNLRRVVHLHGRAGFAATWGELQRDLKEGPQASIDRLLTGKVRKEGAPADFAAFSDKLVRLAAASGDLGRLKAWWVYRMLFSPDPLGERLTLFWHNHFATGARKAGWAVRRQNEIFRKLARAPFAELLAEVVHDPALLLWLDAQANRKGHPNENLARELMELFTLGVGHYTEADVKEAARALTGWTVDKDRFREDPGRHDDGEKTILGRTGRWRGDDLVRMLLDHPATAERLAGRLVELFMGEGVVSAGGVRALAAGLRDHRLDTGWAVGVVLRSQVFFEEANLGSRVLGPVEYVVGAARALELTDPAPSTLVLAEVAANLGHDLFNPPNVGGWPGGRAWITSRSVIGRYNYAVALLDGVDVGRGAAADLAGLARQRRRHGDLETVLGFFEDLLLGHRPGPRWRAGLLAALGDRPAAEPGTLRRAVALILASPEAQVN